MPGKRILPAGRVGCAAQIFAAIYRAKGGGRAATVVEVRQESAMPEIEPSVQTGERKVNKLKRILSLIFWWSGHTRRNRFCFLLLHSSHSGPHSHHNFDSLIPWPVPRSPARPQSDKMT